MIDKLAHFEVLDPKYRDHNLINDKYYKNCRECHITPDWLLIYRRDNEKLILILIDTGSHSELFNIWKIKLLPINPAPPVTNTAIIMFLSTAYKRCMQDGFPKKYNRFTNLYYISARADCQYFLLWLTKRQLCDKITSVEVFLHKFALIIKEDSKWSIYLHLQADFWMTQKISIQPQTNCCPACLTDLFFIWQLWFL